VNGLLRVSVSDAFDFLTDTYIYAQFLLKFAAQAVLEGFSWLALAAGKFPQASEVPAGGALRDEELSGAEDEAG
jgi:hypothetical protein